MLVQFHVEPSSGETCSRKFDVHFIQVQVSDNQEVRKWTFFFSKQSSGNQAVGNWMFWSGNNCIAHRQVDFSDNHDVTNLETRFLFRPHFLTNMLSELVLVLQSPYLKGTSFAKPFRVSRSAAFDCHESQIYRDTATFVDPSEWQVLG